MEKFYVTTPIYYINDKPHIGHAYTTIVADIVARWHRMNGKTVVFATGTDENSQKSVEAAQKVGAEAVSTYIDEMAAVWEKTWDAMSLTHTEFVRTTEPRHLVAVKKFFTHVQEKGDIYKGEYVGLYCIGCEAYKKTSDLNDAGECPSHKRKPEELKEENYFFKLSAYRDQLLEYIEQNPEFIQPVSRRNEIVNYIKDHMEDVSISRQSQDWGIPVPGDDSQVLYVWFDALINYLSALDYGTDDKRFAAHWPADLHLVGKDIIKFHCALWPAMLMSAGVALPKQVFAHGFFTIGGEKMSKSLGNVIDPVSVGEKFGLDALRYLLIREIKFGEDGDFSVEKLAKRYEEELGNELGNLVSRAVVMTHKFAKGVIPNGEPVNMTATWDQVSRSFNTLDFFTVIDAIWGEIRAVNKYITDQAPWKLAKENPDAVLGVLYHIIDRLYHIAWMLTPIMPEVSDKILAQLGYDVTSEREKACVDICNTHVASGQIVAEAKILFPKIEQ